MRRAAPAAAFVVFAALVSAQAPPAQKFEVASVKTMKNGNGSVHGGPGTSSPERITYSGVTLMSLLEQTYKVARFQVSGPEWLSQERYEIIANLPPETTKDGLNAMVQNLLADRFQLNFHHETKELTSYELIVAKGGFKLKESANVLRLPDGRIAQMGSAGAPAGRTDGKNRLSGRSASMALLASSLEFELGTLVKDKTGLTGYYDYQVDYASGAGDASTQSPAPLLSTVLEDFGLKLQKIIGPIDILVVDRVLRQPTEN